MITIEKLEEFVLLDGVKSTTLSTILKLGIFQKYNKDEYLIMHGDDSTSLIFILAGQVSIERYIDDQLVSFVIRDAGEVIGEIACITGEPRSAFVRTVVPVEILKVPSKVVFQMLEEDTSFCINMLRMLSEKLRQSVEGRTSSTLKLSQKLALEVYNEFRNHRVSMPNGDWTLDRKITQNEWAARVSARRESVSRELKVLVQLGAIDFSDGKMVLKNKKILKMRAN